MKNRHQKSTIFPPLAFHRLRPHENHWFLRICLANTLMFTMPLACTLLIVPSKSTPFPTSWFICYLLARGDHPDSWRNASRMQGQMEIFHVGSHQLRESLRELLRELWFSYCSSREMIHSENGISHSENQVLNSESCSENGPPRPSERPTKDRVSAN